MKITRLSSLFSSASDRYQIAAEPPEQESAGVQAAQVRNEEAAAVSSDLELDGSSSADRQEKVQRLKNQIEARGYNPDSREVATAMLKELGSL